MQKIVSFQHHVIIIYSYCLTLFQDEIVPELPAAAKKETAWERGLKLAKEVRSAVYIPVFYIKKETLTFYIPITYVFVLDGEALGRNLHLRMLVVLRLRLLQ